MNKKILVVEDEPALLAALVDKLSREGFVVKGARNGQEGLSSALADHPDLILLDIIMPVMDGMAMLSQLRKDPWGTTVPVILLTNLSEIEKVSMSLLQGVYDYLVKSDCKFADVVKRIKGRLRLAA